MGKGLKIKNNQTGAERTRVHHCHDCRGAMKESCKNSHVFFCEDCGELFNGKQGCFVHAYRDGYNIQVEADYFGKKPRTVVITNGFGMRKEETPPAPPIELKDPRDLGYKQKRKDLFPKPCKNVTEDDDQADQNDTIGDKYGRPGKRGTGPRTDSKKANGPPLGGTKKDAN